MTYLVQKATEAQSLASIITGSVIGVSVHLHIFSWQVSAVQFLLV